MPSEACERCGKQVDASKLLFSEAGRVCGSCELELGDVETESAANWTLALGGPLMAFTAFILMLTVFVPVFGLITGALSPMVALVAVGLGVRAFLKSGEAPDGERTLLVLCGAVAVPAGLLVFVSSVVFLLVTLVQLAAEGTY